MARSPALVVLLSLAASAACAGPQPTTEASPIAWRTLFGGEGLGDFVPTSFGAEGEVRVEGGKIVLDQGDPLTGVTWRGAELPHLDYAIELRAARLRGTDFFCALTFPVGDSNASLILGGWGGALCGISSLDGLDASDNETTVFRGFQTGREYLVRVEVRADRLRAFVDGERIVDVSIVGRRVDVRAEVRASIPFGIASFATRASIADVRICTLPPATTAGGGPGGGSAAQQVRNPQLDHALPMSQSARSPRGSTREAAPAGRPCGPAGGRRASVACSFTR